MSDLYFSQFQRVGSLRSRHQQIPYLVKAIFSLSLHTAEGARELSGVSFIKALTPFVRATPYSSPKGPTSKILSHWGLGFNL